MAIPFDRKLSQIAFVVKDIEEARQRFAALLGVEAPPIITTPPGDEVGAVYRGRPTTDQANLVFFELPNIQLELIEPIGTESAWAEDLATKGEHVHHIAFWTEDMNAASSFVEGQGAPLVMRGDFGDHSGEYVYFDGKAKFGCFIEILGRK
ncbi:MAG TPA: VOC family protein [Fimbriimonadaceae bacterium]|jgi:catechol 2,3-dioxygenase-like lactoylglutathione lyase family enzyme